MVKKVGILGFSREGRSVLKFLTTDLKWKNSEMTILDRNKNLHKPLKKGLLYKLGKDYLKDLDKFDVLFRSPGVYYNYPEIQKAKKKGVEILSATKLFFDLVSQEKIIGVTGTKGKGTVSTLIYEILKASKKNVIIAGNIGKPMLDQLKAAKNADYVVLELSSFQLQDLKKSPHVAVILDITPDHLEIHKNFDEYVFSKASITHFQKKSDLLFHFPGSKEVERIIKKSKAKSKIIPIMPSEFNLFTPEELYLPGDHNFYNAVIAANVAQKLGISDQIIRNTTIKFKGLPYRLQFIRFLPILLPGVKEKFKLNFYNDSASTNPESASVAVLAFDNPSVLIAGGSDKNLNYKPLLNFLLKSSVKHVLLFGENKKKIFKAINQKNTKYSVQLVDDLEVALARARILAHSLITQYHKSSNVIFSPASASFDMFTDLYERGAIFNSIVKKL